MSFNFNVTALMDFLKENNLEPKLQEKTDMPYIIYEMQECEVPVFFLLRTESYLLQMIAYLPFKLASHTFGDTGRMLHILNKELDMPGFGMDEEEGLVFFRSVIPCPLQTIDEYLLKRHLANARFVCNTFLQGVKALATGEMDLSQVMKDNKFN